MQCRFCDGEITPSAKKCRHCGEWLQPSDAAVGQDERETCGGCGKRMIPRIITGPPLIHGQGSWTPVPKKSVCPHCGTTHRKFPPSLGEKIGVGVFVVVLVFFAITMLR